MKVACLQENLQRALGRVSRAVATRTTLRCSAMSGSDRGRALKIAATNMEIGVTTWIDAAVEQEGRSPSTPVAGRIRQHPAGGEVRLDVDRDRLVLTVRAGRDKAAINGIDAEDFPVITSMKAADFTVTIAAQTLRERISLVEFAAATDDSRPVLAGVLTRFDGDAMMLASADGFRMAVAEGPSGTAVEQRVDVIVPAARIASWPG